MRLSTATISRLGSSHFNYWFGYVANIALVVWMASHAWQGGAFLLRPSRALACIGAGLALWTFLEYVLHRFVYHAIASSLQVGHDLHHRSPKALIGVPWYVSGVGVVAVFLGAYAMCPMPHTGLGLAATWGGYIGYCVLHHASHHWRMPAGYLRRIKRHHLVHHAHPDYNWGLTTPVWDVVCGTYYASHSKEVQRTADPQTRPD